MKYNLATTKMLPFRVSVRYSDFSYKNDRQISKLAYAVV